MSIGEDRGVLKRQLVWLLIFSIAMAYLESAVVVYLREIYYPDGFSFPLTPIDASIAATEFWREVATIVMLVGIGVLTGKSAMQRFAFFLIAFAIWDIFYYVFLYVLIGWPSSLLTWDILFLVPIPWVGPVISPLIISMLMIALGMSLIRYKQNLSMKEWGMLTAGSLVVITSWILDYWKFNEAQLSQAWTLSSEQELFSSSTQYIPAAFDWAIFLLGVAILLVANGFYYNRARGIQLT